MKKIFTVVLGFLLLGAVGVGFFLMRFDAKVLRPYLIKEAAVATGRTLTIDGRLKTHFSLSPTIEIEKVALSDPQEEGQSPIMTAEQVTLNVSLWSLIRGKTALNYLSFSGVTVALERNEQGETNWDFNANSSMETAKTADETVAQPVKTPIRFLKNMPLKKVAVHELALSYVDKQSQKMYQIFFPEAVVDRNAEGGITAEIQTRIERKLLTFNMTTSDVEALFAADRSFKFDLFAKGLQSSAEIHGKVNGGIDNGDISFTLDAKSKKIERVVALFNKRILPFGMFKVTATASGKRDALSLNDISITLGKPETAEFALKGNVGTLLPFDNLAAQVSVTANDFGSLLNSGVFFAPFTAKAQATYADKTLSVSDIVFASDDSDVTGTFRMTNDEKTDFLLKLTSEKMNLNKLVAAQNKKSTEETMPSSVFVAPLARQTFFSKTPFDEEALRKINGKASLVFKNLTAANGAFLGDIPVTVDVSQGNFKLEPVRIGTSFSVEAGFNASVMPAQAFFMLKTRDFSLSQLLAQKGIVSGTALTNISLSSSGNSVAQMAANLTGNVFLFASDIGIQNVALDGLKLVLPPSKDMKNQPALTVDCLVANFPVFEGQIDMKKRIAMQTSHFNVQASGEIDLKKETLALDFVTGVKGEDALRSLSGTLSVTGEMKDPIINFEVDNVIGKALNAGLQYLFSGPVAAQEAMAPLVPDTACRTALEGDSAIQDNSPVKKERRAK